MADEDLHPFRPHALIEQVQDIVLLTEGLEERLQRLDVGQTPAAHEIRLAGEHELGLRLRIREDLMRHLDGLDHQRVHRRPRLLEVGEEQLADLRQRMTAEAFVQVVRRLAQLVGAEISLHVHDFVLDLAIVHDEDREHALTGQRQELDLAQRRLRAPRHRHDARELRDGG